MPAAITADSCSLCWKFHTWETPEWGFLLTVIKRPAAQEVHMCKSVSDSCIRAGGDCIVRCFCLQTRIPNSHLVCQTHGARKLRQNRSFARTTHRFHIALEYASSGSRCTRTILRQRRALPFALTLCARVERVYPIFRKRRWKLTFSERTIQSQSSAASAKKLQDQYWLADV